MKRSIPILVATRALAAAGGAAAKENSGLTGKERAAEARAAAEARKAEQVRNENAATPAIPAVPADPSSGTAATPAIPAVPAKKADTTIPDTTISGSASTTTSSAKGKSK